MSAAGIDSYLMNPETDTIVFAGDLAEGMEVLPESWEYRINKAGGCEDRRLRQERFRVVTRLRTAPDQLETAARAVLGNRALAGGRQDGTKAA